ncbi:MAG: 3-dehydroquinate synthase [Gammaproteobacteria bacterium]|nr:3-dehydroquinate synthase [Gammaproteobacteria bacterium]
MTSVTVNLADRSYAIHIGPGLLDNHELLAASAPARQIMIVTNETIAPLYQARVAAAFAGRDVVTHVLPDGEQYKTMEYLQAILTSLLEHRFARDAMIVALGGGVVGDIAGFAAAIYQRGMDFIQIPTTLLAQVDSSVGGKTAVNHPLGKNMVGAFHQPLAVISDLQTVDTLAPREYRAGLAEVIKYGLIYDQTFYLWLQQNMAALLAREPAALTHAIRRSCEIKAEVVGQDERENGLRAILNLGHTFGHAIEAGLGYGTWLHGEAVAAGMCAAAHMSHQLGWLDGEDVTGLNALVAACGLPTTIPADLDERAMLKYMAVDKKVRQGQLRLVLLSAIGRAVVTSDYQPADLSAALQACR